MWQNRKPTVWDFCKVIVLIKGVTLSQQVTFVLAPLPFSAWNLHTMTCLKPAESNGTGIGRTLNHGDHHKWLHQPQSVHLHNSCLVRTIKSRLSYATVCKWLLHSKGYDPYGYSPFPVLGKLYRQGQAEEMESSHKTSQETNNKSRSFFVQNTVQPWAVLYNQWNSVLLKFLKVWVLSLANRRIPVDTK